MIYASTTTAFIYNVSQIISSISSSVEALKLSCLSKLTPIIQIGIAFSFAYLIFNPFSYIKNKIDKYLSIAQTLLQTKTPALERSIG